MIGFLLGILMAVAITQTANPAGVSTTADVATYTAASIGTASADRIVLVGSGNEENTARAPTSATIDYGTGDLAMTALTLAQIGDVSSRIFYLPAPTGITATIKVTWPGAATNLENHIAVYSVTGADPTPASSGTNTSTDMDATAPLTTGPITILTGAAFFGVAAGATDTDAKTWANATEDLDVDAGAFRYTTAISTTAGTPTVTCTGTSDGEDGALAWIIFNPAAVADTLSAQSVM